jgi:hypothetical protein
LVFFTSDSPRASASAGKSLIMLVAVVEKIGKISDLELLQKTFEGMK